MELRDIYNWQMGQYNMLAYTETLARSFGKNINIYPKKPQFSNAFSQETKSGELTKEQEELETMKFQDFFSHLSSHVAIKKKGGRDGRRE